MRKFIEILDGNKAGKIIKAGDVFNKKRFGVNSPNETYIKEGLVPIINGIKPDYNVLSERLEISYRIEDNQAVEEYNIISTETDTTKLQRYARLELIFNEKILGLKKMAIDKPNMTNTEAINNQYEQYKAMYESAKKQDFDTETNLAIIENHEKARKFLAGVTLLLNTVKTKLEEGIENDIVNIDALLNDAENLTLSINEITPTKIIEIKTNFGI